MLLYPTLYAFLAYLRLSTVLEVRYRGNAERREMRWTRLSREDDFEAECWTLG
jgi:hypothetical protein